MPMIERQQMMLGELQTVYEWVPTADECAKELSDEVTDCREARESYPGQLGDVLQLLQIYTKDFNHVIEAYHGDGDDQVVHNPFSGERVKLNYHTYILNEMVSELYLDLKKPLSEEAYKAKVKQFHTTKGLIANFYPEVYSLLVD